MIGSAFNYSQKTISLYIHYPFCKRLCPYCDFFKVQYSKDLERVYIDGLKKEFEVYNELILRNYNTATIYVGGGSPSIASPEFFNFLEFLNSKLNLCDKPEFTIELNPEDINDNLILRLANSPINRLSIGVQSLDEDVLKFLSREVNLKTFKNNFEKLNKIIENISFDILYGFPEKLSENHIKNFSNIKDFNLKHVSLYFLTIYEGTAFYKRFQEVSHLLNDDEIYKKYLKFIEQLNVLNFKHYEVSNFAKPGYESQHNLQYWLFHNYLGLGPSASSKIFSAHWKNYNDLNTYHSSLENGNLSVAGFEMLTHKQLVFERLFLFLRLRRKVNKIWLNDLTGTNPERLKQFYIDLKRNNLIEDYGEVFELTDKGLMVSEEVFLRYLK